MKTWCKRYYLTYAKNGDCVFCVLSYLVWSIKIKYDNGVWPGYLHKNEVCGDPSAKPW